MVLTSLTSRNLCADRDFTIFGCNGSLSLAINLSPQSSEPLPSAKLVLSSMNGVPALPFGLPSLPAIPLSRRRLSALSSGVDIIVTRFLFNYFPLCRRCYVTTEWFGEFTRPKLSWGRWENPNTFLIVQNATVACRVPLAIFSCCSFLTNSSCKRLPFSER